MYNFIHYNKIIYKQRKCKRHFLFLTGFTLIEVLLSLFITAILITILSVVFNTGLRSYRQGKDLMEITRKAQLILGQMTRELKGAIVQNNIPFEGMSNEVRFVAPLDNSGDIDLCGIKYSLDGDKLRRLINVFNKGDTYPDVLTDFSGNGVQFCDGIKDFNLQYRPIGGVFAGSWPSNTTSLPELVEISVTIQGKYTSKQFTTWVYLPNSTNNP